jgi:hypothetical protein
LFAVLALAVLLASNIAPPLRLALFGLVAVSVCLSAVIYYSTERHPLTLVTPAEQAAVNWASGHTSSRQTVFTDERLAGGLVGQGHVNTDGVSDYVPPTFLLKQLRDVYYGGSPKLAAVGLSSVQLPTGSVGIKYVLLSHLMESDLPGIKATDYNFRGAKAGFMAKFARIPGAYLVYNNGTVETFEMTGNHH